MMATWSQLDANEYRFTRNAVGQLQPYGDQKRFPCRLIEDVQRATQLPFVLHDAASAAHKNCGKWECLVSQLNLAWTCSALILAVGDPTWLVGSPDMLSEPLSHSSFRVEWRQGIIPEPLAGLFLECARGSRHIVNNPAATTIAAPSTMFQLSVSPKNNTAITPPTTS